jgi:FkbM family methyltransferase
MAPAATTAAATTTTAVVVGGLEFVWIFVLGRQSRLHQSALSSRLHLPTSCTLKSLRKRSRPFHRVVEQRLHVARARWRFRGDTDRARGTWIGNEYSGWPLPDETLSRESICYLAGLGEDASFDLELIDRFGCEVHAFDPVPEAVRYGTAVQSREPRFHFHPFGLWSEDASLVFHDNPIEGFVSRSATDLHEINGGLELPVKGLAGLSQTLGHDRIDLLKLSVEGSEYRLIDVLINERLEVGTVLIEFAQPAPLSRVCDAVDRLEAGGWRLVEISLQPFNWRACFQGLETLRSQR